MFVCECECVRKCGYERENRYDDAVIHIYICS